MVFLFSVEHAFHISGRGCVLAPGLPTEPDSPKVKIGDAIELITPDGTTLRTHIHGMEILNYGKKPARETHCPH